jgi:SSS family solute:Na+ symporter
VIETGVAEHKFDLGDFSLDFSTSSFWVVLMYGFFINLTNFGIDQNYIQRYHTAKNTQDAAKSVWLCAMYFLPVSFLFFLIGTALYVFYGQNPALIFELKQQVAAEKGIAIEALKAADYGDKVLPFFMKTQIPTGFLGLLMAALLSAAMSTMSSGMNSSATVFLNDIYMRYVDKDVAPKKQLRILHVATAVMGIMGITFGISMIGVKSLLDVWWKLSGIFAGGMLGIFLMGYLAKNVVNWQAKIAATIGVIIIAMISFKDNLPEAYRLPLDSKMTVVIGTLSIVGTGFVLSKIFKK